MKRDYTNDKRFLAMIPEDASLNCRAVCAVLFTIDSFHQEEALLAIPLEVLQAINTTVKMLTPIDYEHVGYFIALGSGLYNPNNDTPVVLHRLGLGVIKRLTNTLAAKLMATIPKH